MRLGVFAYEECKEPSAMISVQLHSAPNVRPLCHIDPPLPSFVFANFAKGKI